MQLTAEADAVPVHQVSVPGPALRPRTAKLVVVSSQVRLQRHLLPMLSRLQLLVQTLEHQLEHLLLLPMAAHHLTQLERRTLAMARESSSLVANA